MNGPLQKREQNCSENWVSAARQIVSPTTLGQNRQLRVEKASLDKEAFMLGKLFQCLFDFVDFPR